MATRRNSKPAQGAASEAAPPAQATAQSRSAQASAIYPAGYGVHAFHGAKAASEPGSAKGDEEAALASLMALRAAGKELREMVSDFERATPEKVPTEYQDPETGKQPFLMSDRRRTNEPSAYVKARETKNWQLKAGFYTHAKQRGPGAENPPLNPEHDPSRFTPCNSEAWVYGMETGRNLEQDITAAKKRAQRERARKAGAMANAEASTVRREQVRAIWEALPARLRTGGEVRKRLLEAGVEMKEQTINRHIRELGKREPGTEES